MDYTSKDSLSQTKHFPERIVEQIIEVQVLLLILEETVAMMKLAPHEQAQTTEKTAEFPQPQVHQQGCRSREGTETNPTEVEMK